MPCKLVVLKMLTGGSTQCERYRGIDDYMSRISRATDDLIRRRFLLSEDRDAVLTRAKNHWLFASTMFFSTRGCADVTLGRDSRTTPTATVIRIMASSSARAGIVRGLLRGSV